MTWLYNAYDFALLCRYIISHIELFRDMKAYIKLRYVALCYYGYDILHWIILHDFTLSRETIRVLPLHYNTITNAVVQVYVAVSQLLCIVIDIVLVLVGVMSYALFLMMLHCVCCMPLVMCVACVVVLMSHYDCWSLAVALIVAFANVALLVCMLVCVAGML